MRIYECPNCGSKIKSYDYNIFTKDLISEHIVCINCDKMFEIRYKIVFDSINEIK